MRIFLIFLFSITLCKSLFAQVNGAQSSSVQASTKSSTEAVTEIKTNNDAKLNDSIKNCIEKKELASCLVAVPRLQSEKQYALAFKTGEILCELEPTHCFSVYFISLSLDKKKAELFFTKLISECEKNADFCDAVANIHEEQKNYELALQAAKKYFTKHKQGSYILLAHKYGNKQEAYTASLADCKSNQDQCVFYLRYFYEHPQKSEILENSIKSCVEQKQSSIGANNCAILGTYYFKIQEFDLAYKHWSKDCETNSTSCLLILGSKRFNDEINLLTLKKFCSTKGGPTAHFNLQLVECEKIEESTVRVPPAIEKFAVESLKAFVNEQKLSN